MAGNRTTSTGVDTRPVKVQQGKPGAQIQMPSPIKFNKTQPGFNMPKTIVTPSK